jgi:hypothetical protein
MKTVNMQNQKMLLQLYGMLHCSFARYLSYARPWSRRPYTLLMAISRKLADDHQHYASEIAQLLAARRQITSSPTFPTDFTYYNDVSLEYLAPKLLQHQRFLIGVTAAASGALAADRETNRILTKLFVSLRTYADVLEELLTRSSKGSFAIVPASAAEAIEGSSSRVNYDSASAEPQTAA